MNNLKEKSAGMGNLKETGYISTIILFVITLITTVLLSAANEFTAPVIADNEAKSAIIAHQEVFPDAENFRDLTDEINKVNYPAILNVFGATNDAGTFLGLIIETQTYGYGGPIRVMTGISVDFSTTAVIITSHSETPGLGSKITNPSFTDSFLAADSGAFFYLRGQEFKEQNEVKQAEAQEIDGVTGATLSAKAVIEAVNIAMDFAKQNMNTLSNIFGGN